MIALSTYILQHLPDWLGALVVVLGALSLIATTLHGLLAPLPWPWAKKAAAESGVVGVALASWAKRIVNFLGKGGDSGGAAGGPPAGAPPGIERGNPFTPTGGYSKKVAVRLGFAAVLATALLCVLSAQGCRQIEAAIGPTAEVAACVTAEYRETERLSTPIAIVEFAAKCLLDCGSQAQEVVDALFGSTDPAIQRSPLRAAAARLKSGEDSMDEFRARVGARAREIRSKRTQSILDRVDGTFLVSAAP